MLLPDGTHLCTRCRRVFDAGKWGRLPYVGRQTFDYPDGITEDFELRNCRCGGTMAASQGERCRTIERPRGAGEEP